MIRGTPSSLEYDALWPLKSGWNNRNDHSATMCIGKVQKTGPIDGIPVESKLERTGKGDTSRNRGGVMCRDDEPQCCERLIVL